ncbi:MAG: HD family phosphohydrolase [Nostocaceae cyanobacterium]|nr:HD family phosphohydrolase [Nostocaceae cyanobacterium]
MKTQPFLQSLTQQMTHWQRQWRLIHRFYGIKIRKQAAYRKRRASKPMVKSVKIKNSIYSVGLSAIPRSSPVMFAIAVVSLTGVMGNKLYSQPQLQVGTIAPDTIKAPQTSLIEDKKKTEQERKKASRSSLPILMLDTSVNQTIDQQLQQLLDEGNRIRGSAGAFPFFETSTLSLASQAYLRSCTESEWQALLIAVNKVQKQKSDKLEEKQGFYLEHGGKIRIKKAFVNNPSLVTASFARVEDPQGDYLSQNGNFSQVLAEIKAYRFKTSPQNVSALISTIERSRKKYAQAKAKLAQLASVNSEKVYENTSLLDLSDENWAKTQMGIQRIAERMLTQGIPPGLPPNRLQEAVNLHVQSLVPKDAEALASKILLAVLQPNLKKDELKTKLQAEQRAAQVQPVMVSVRQGQVIVRKGEEITQKQFLVLESYGLIRREINWLGLAQMIGFVSGSVGIFVLVEWRILHKRLRQRDCILILLLSLSTPLAVIMGIPYTTWSCIGILLGSFYGSVVGVTVVGLLSALLGLGLEISKVALIAGAAGGILGSSIAHRLRSREELALLGLGIAFTQGGVYLLLKLLLGTAVSPLWYLVLQDATLFGLSGLVWSIVALGLSPYLEKIFDVVTPIRLAELANPNRPLLKKLANQTPGTFQHTLFVATLAEAAAKELGCNVELVRAGVLYHDIGKMHDPLAFIENQMGGPNKHDTEIKDPWKSAEIIKKHVTQGLVMARKHSLPTAIQAFIPEHQGTMQIAYFYHQAEQQAKEDPSIILDEGYFRYDGPIPQSRETGIVMLADSCEAALRSLKDATPEKALTMVNNILRARWKDNQMVDSGLTREEMTEIAEIFVRVWQQFHHKRIAYPKLKAGKQGNG